MANGTLTNGRLADHPLWSRALRRDSPSARSVVPVIVSASVEDREAVEGLPGIERLSITELVREARTAAAAGIAGLMIFGASDRKDELALLASQPDHIVPRAIRCVKDAVPDLAVATDVCVCAYTAHGQCVLFGREGADVAGTLERLREIAAVHAEAGSDLLVPSGMLDGTVAALREALADAGIDVPIAATAKLESCMYQSHRVAVGATPIRDRAVPLLAGDDPGAARARARRDVHAGADAVIVKPSLVTLDIVAMLARETDKPIVSYQTLDEHLALVAAGERLTDERGPEREALRAARRAGADLVIAHGAASIAED
ncbi:MAG: porphobilinogen synthase [Chloroflexota bacterium]|nr:porphobilinogen synthase [Chloroflexota bacterium]